MGNKSSVLRSSSRAEEANATPRVAASGPSAALAEPPQQGEPSGPVAKLLTGNIASVRPVEQVPRGPTALDQKITSALRERWEARAHQDKDNQFTRILLKFPQAAEAFDSVRSTFRVYDRENKGYIEFADLSRVFEQLGANFSSEEISMVFQESDMMKDGKLNFKEFLVCLAIGFVLHKIPSLEGERLSIFYAPISRTGSNSTPAPAPTQSILFGEGNKLRLAFQLAVDAFLWFDVDGDGVINRSEMSTKLQHSMALHSPTKKMTADDMNKDTSDDSSNQAIWEQRFMEMDWNGDGTIQFKEFLMAFESWVGLEDDDSMSTSSFRYAG